MKIFLKVIQWKYFESELCFYFKLSGSPWHLVDQRNTTLLDKCVFKTHKETSIQFNFTLYSMGRGWVIGALTVDSVKMIQYGGKGEGENYNLQKALQVENFK